MSQHGNDERPQQRGPSHRPDTPGGRDYPAHDTPRRDQSSRGYGNRDQSGGGGGRRGAPFGQDRRRDDRGGARGAGRPPAGGQRYSRDADAAHRPPREPEPTLPEDIQAADLDADVRRDLISLEKSSAEAVARHLLMAERVLLDDPVLALEHARAARRRASRIAVVREAAGVAAYYAGEWAEALNELRTARRIGGGAGLIAMMADCERGLGRPEKAIELGRSEEARVLTGEQAAELRIVVAGARMDLGQFDAAVVTLQTPDLDPKRVGPDAARLFYAYAEALAASGRTAEAVEWFLRSNDADDEETDAEERAAELSKHEG